MPLRLFDLTRSQRRTMFALDGRRGSALGKLNRRQLEDVEALWPLGLVDETRRRLTDRGRHLRDHGIVGSPWEATIMTSDEKTRIGDEIEAMLDDLAIEDAAEIMTIQMAAVIAQGSTNLEDAQDLLDDVRQDIASYLQNVDFEATR